MKLKAQTSCRTADALYGCWNGCAGVCGERPLVRGHERCMGAACMIAV